MDINDQLFTTNKQNNKLSIQVDIDVIKGDITTRQVDVIVNAAHSDLTGGGGVDGAIHKAAGDKLLGECLNLYGCREGEARITGGYNLFAKYIIHTVGPVWTYPPEEQEKAKKILPSCYINCLNFAEKQGLKSISFPCISTGAYCFPKELAANIVISTIHKWIHHNVKNNGGCYIDLIEIVCFSDNDVDIYKKAIKDNE